MRALRLAQLATVAAALMACADEAPKPPPASGEGTSGGPTPPAPAGEACTFAQAPAEFALPIIPGLALGSFRTVTGKATCTNGREVDYELRDMNGDRQPDLVLRSACDDTTIGPLAWRVHFNTGTGFDANPTRFDLPLPRPPACALVELADADGDLRPDLVTTSTCLDASVGTTRWILHRNNGAGFDAAADFTLPPAPVKGAFTRFESESLTAACPGGAPAYRTFDIDGDLKIDLVVPSACDDAFLATTTWRVYKGTGTGFDPTPSSFALPTFPAPFRKMYADPRRGTADCGASPLARSYELADFDGDFAPDLLVTQQCNDATVGSTRWLFYRNEGTRLAPEPRSLELPILVGALGNHGAFHSTSSEAKCESYRPAFTIVDVTGDFKKDLLFTRSCNDPTSGVSRWLLYPQRTDGAFEKTPLTLTLPTVLGGRADAPLGLSAEASCERATTKRPAFFATHLTANRFGLVVTTACLDPSVGHLEWLIYGNDCTTE
jgi:hypothetical protein